MKRAEVWFSGYGYWTHLVTHCPRAEPHKRIAEAVLPDDVEDDITFMHRHSTHAEALYAALTAVGLTRDARTGEYK